MLFNTTQKEMNKRKNNGTERNDFFAAKQQDFSFVVD